LLGGGISAWLGELEQGRAAGEPAAFIVRCGIGKTVVAGDVADRGGDRAPC